MCCEKNSSCSNLSSSVVNAVVFVLYLFWELHISWVVVLAVNPPIYVEFITLYIEEWLPAFSCVLSFYFVVSFDEAVDTVTQMLCKVQQHYIMQRWFRTNLVLVIQFFLYEPSTRFWCRIHLWFRYVGGVCKESRWRHRVPRSATFTPAHAPS